MQRHSDELQAAVGREEEALHARNSIADELADLQAQVEETQALVTTLQEEKQDMQADMTQLEAEVQRSLSLQRYQESQLKDWYVL